MEKSFKNNIEEFLNGFFIQPFREYGQVFVLSYYEFNYLKDNTLEHIVHKAKYCYSYNKDIDFAHIQAYCFDF